MTYHPGTRDLRATLGTVALVGGRSGAPGIASPATDLGTEAAWSQVQPQTPESRTHAFGADSCAVPVARFDRGAFHLSFVPTDHVRANPAARDTIFSGIRGEFEGSHPAEVVVEGYPDPFPCDEAVRIFMTPVQSLESEPEYLAKLALDHGAAILGGEPSDIGLDSPDRERFLLLRQMTTLRGTPAPEAFHRVQAMFPFGAAVSFSDFSAWYRHANGRSFSLENALADITPSFNVTVAGGTARGTNRMADRVDLNLDSNVLRVIRRGLLEGGRVMVVYGRDHFPRQLPVLEGAFGPHPTPVAGCTGIPAAPQADDRCPDESTPRR